jgi:tRNA (guanine-N7-)-methyltransferase
VIQTDNPGYWKYIRAVVPVFFELRELEGKWPDAPRGRTRREIIAMQKGLPVFRAEAFAKPDLSAADALALAESLPPPTFDADRRLRDLDRLA